MFIIRFRKSSFSPNLWEFLSLKSCEYYQNDHSFSSFHLSLWWISSLDLWIEFRLQFSSRSLCCVSLGLTHKRAAHRWALDFRAFRLWTGGPLLPMSSRGCPHSLTHWQASFPGGCGQKHGLLSELQLPALRAPCFSVTEACPQSRTKQREKKMRTPPTIKVTGAPFSSTSG